jgi:hypothetical protein
MGGNFCLPAGAACRVGDPPRPEARRFLRGNSVPSSLASALHEENDEARPERRYQ